MTIDEGVLIRRMMVALNRQMDKRIKHTSGTWHQGVITMVNADNSVQVSIDNGNSVQARIMSWYGPTQGDVVEVRLLRGTAVVFGTVA